MKTNSKPREVVTEAGEASTFTISNNSKIFRILIDGLYADKIQSVTREIWSNALDSHTQAGHPERPFDVSFPTAFDPTFRVRDYGVSLTHEQVMYMYTDLGTSTKEDTNDAIGKFGIGSKSPFAYTDNFTVTAVLDGEKRFYSAMIGADGVPAIHLMGTEAAEEENGVEVAFPVEKVDVGAFRQAAIRVSHGFDVKPTVTNDPAFDGWPELDLLMEGDGWRLLKGVIEGFREGAYARMGPVLYPINVGSLPDLDPVEAKLLRSTLIVDFDMGELEITASREELSYGRYDPTATSIKTKVETIANGIREKVEADIDAKPTYFEACIRYRELEQDYRSPEVVRIAARGATWRGQSLKDHISIRSAKNVGLNLSIHSRTQLEMATYKFKPTYNPKITAHDRTLVVFQDDSPGTRVHRTASRIQHAYKTHDYNQIVWVRIHDIRTARDSIIHLMEQLDGAEFVNAADLELPKTELTSTGKYERKPVLARILRQDFSKCIELSPEEFEEGGFYVPLERNVEVTDLALSAYRCRQLLVSTGLLDAETWIIGAPKTLWNKFKGDQWTNFFDYVREQAQLLDMSTVPEIAARNRAKRAVGRDKVLEFLANYVDATKLTEGSPVHFAMDLKNRAHETEIVDVDSILSLARACDLVVPESEQVDEMEEDLAAVLEEVDYRYPLLSVFYEKRLAYYDIPVDKVTDYVILCDTHMGANQLEAAVAA